MYGSKSENRKSKDTKKVSGSKERNQNLRNSMHQWVTKESKKLLRKIKGLISNDKRLIISRPLIEETQDGSIKDRNIRKWRL